MSKNVNYYKYICLAKWLYLQGVRGLHFQIIKIMKTKKLKLTALLVLTLFASINLANAQDTPPAGTPVIAMTVTNNATIRMSFYMEAAGTIWVETAPGNFTPAILAAGWNNHRTFTATGTTLKVHGNIARFECSGNGTKLTGLNPSGNTQLLGLQCNNNSLTALNVSALTELTDLNCNLNNIASLDVSQNTRLTRLECGINKNLQTLNLTANTELTILSCSSCKLTGLDISANTKLKELNCSLNPFPEGAGLDVSNNMLLEELMCFALKLTSLNIAPLTKLKSLNIKENRLDACALDKIYSCLPAVTSGDLYNEDNPGTATSKTSIATAKGWTNNITAGDGTGCSTVFATVTTSDATAIAHNSATLGGVIVPGTETITERGIEWKKTTGGTYATLVAAGTGNTFTVKRTGLAATTSYTFRAYIKVGTEKRYGAEKTFTTAEPPIPSTVATDAATAISQTKATLNATITPGNDVIAQRGFEWKKTAGGTYTTLVASGTGNTYTADLANLTPNTGYTFRAYIMIGTTKTYGAEVTFTTSDIIHAEVSTLNATDVDHTVATLNGIVIPIGEVIDERGFEWKETAGGTYADVVSSSTGDTISANLTGLTPNTGYTFRAYAKIGIDKKYGAEYTFTTVEATLNIHRWIDIKVSTGENIKLGFATNDPTTSIMVDANYGVNTQTINGLTTDPSNQQAFYARSNRIRIYGDLSGLDCNGNGTNLSAIDASNNTELSQLICDRNWLWRLDVSKNTALSKLSCSKNQLDTLDISNLTALHTLSCNENRLTMLDVSKNTALRVLSCYGNQLTTQAWDKVYCDLPEITAPDFGTMYPIANATSGDSTIIKRTTSQNAINKGWKVQYGETSQSIPATTGNYTCGTVIPATVTTSDATNVTYTTAVLNGVVAPGSNIINDAGFMYKVTDEGTYTAIIGNYRTDEIAMEINNLIPGANYTFKTCAILGTDTIYGAEKTFTTPTPQVNTNRYIDITVMQDSIISLAFAGKAQNTGVKLVSETNTQYALVGEFTTPIPNFQAKGTTIRVYGDVTGLDCNLNGEKVTGLDFSHNKEMKEIQCMDNSITSLDVSDNKDLSFLYCQNNLLTSLNISNDTTLMHLHCENNKLTSLDVSTNTNLMYLYCHDNNFTTEALDDIYCALPLRAESDNAMICPVYSASSDNHATVMATDSKNATNKNWKVRYFDTYQDIPATTGNHICIVGEVNESRWIELKVAKGDSIQFDFGANVPVPIRIESGTYSKIMMADDVWSYDQPSTDKYYAQDSIIRIYGDITGFNCNENGDKLTGLDASHNPALESLYCAFNALTSLNVSNNPALLELICVLNQLSSLDIRSCTALGLIDCGGNQLTYLDVSNNTALEYLSCHTNSLSSLDVKNNTALMFLMCFDNQFSTQALDDIYCSLPQREQGDDAEMYPILTPFSSNSTIVKKSNKKNATDKYWNVMYADDNAELVTTGTHNCSTAIPATVTTLDATAVTHNSAKLSGVVAPGTDVIAARGFEWKKTTGGTYADLVSDHTSNTFDATLTGLTGNTNYTYRAYVKVGSDKIYGTEKTFTTSTTGIERITQVVSIYPNPAKDILNIKSNDAIENLELYDALGRLVLSQSGESATESTVDVSSLTRGIYILKFRTANGNGEHKIAVSK